MAAKTTQGIWVQTDLKGMSIADRFSFTFLPDGPCPPHSLYRMSGNRDGKTQAVPLSGNPAVLRSADDLEDKLDFLCRGQHFCHRDEVIVGMIAFATCSSVDEARDLLRRALT